MNNKRNDAMQIIKPRNATLKPGASVLALGWFASSFTVSIVRARSNFGMRLSQAADIRGEEDGRRRLNCHVNSNTKTKQQREITCIASTLLLTNLK